MSEQRDIVIGIDLGTTNSLVAYADESGPHLIRDASGEGRMPSFLAFGQDGQVTIGQAAKEHAVENPTATIFSVKRLMGRGFEELTADGELGGLPYPVVRRTSEGGDRDVAAVDVNGQLMTPPQISAMILRELKDRAARHLGHDVRKAVITVPAYFDDAQRQATRDAGQIAGLEVLRIVNEPTAAALAYGLGVRGQLEGEPKNAASSPTKPSADPEGANAGLSLLKLADACPSSEDAGTEGARSACGGSEGSQESIVAVYDLGGGTFDISVLRLVEGIFEVLSTHGDTQLGGDDLDRQIIALIQREVLDQFGIEIDSPAIRQSLRTLSENVKMRLSNEDAAEVEIDLGEGRVYRRTITRTEFETLIAPWVQRTIRSCEHALNDAGLTPDRIDQAIMVGGSTRIPAVRAAVEQFFGRPPYTAMNPDEVVALGAAVQAGILSGSQHDALLLDVIPLSLGIETLGGAMGKLILRNSRIPCQATERFSTFVDGQTSVKINVLQGERELAKNCRSLGEFELKGIPPMPAGMPRLLVSFLIDENGILNVSAKEERSGQEASIQIVPTHGLTPAEVDRMERESYQHAREDMTAHRLIDLRNQITFDTEKAEQMLARVGDQLEKAERERIVRGIAELRQQAQTSEDADELHEALTAFDHGTVHLAELAISASISEVQDAESK